VAPEVAVYAGVDDRDEPDAWRVRFDLDVTRPRRCRFHVVLPLWPTADLIMAGVRAGGMVLASDGKWLWVDLDRRLADLLEELGRRRRAPEAEMRELVLPIEGYAALRTLIGILDDTVAIDPERLEQIDDRLSAAWTPDEWAAMAPLEGAPPDRALSLSIADAALLLDGLRVTEIASTGFPWFEQLVWVSDFVAGHLLGLWSDQEWLAHRDGGS